MARGKNYVRTEVAERIDRPDFNYVAETSQLDGLMQIGNEVIVGQGEATDSTPQSRMWVLRGFSLSNPTGNVLKIEKDDITGRGVAMLACRHAGEVKYGAVVSEGDAFKQIDLTSFPIANGYGVYIRFELRPTTHQNRLFWNPQAAPPTEFPKTIATRTVENWAIAVELTSPGEEWLQIGTLDITGGGLANLTDTRDFFFEGRADNNFVYDDTDWGGAPDRGVTRDTVGVFAFKEWVTAVNRQLQDIIGVTAPKESWVNAPPASLQSLETARQDFVSNKLERDGSQTMNGNLTPGTDSLYHVGLPATRWATVNADQLDASISLNVTGLSTLQQINPAADNTYPIGSSFNRFSEIHGYDVQITNELKALAAGIPNIGSSSFPFGDIYGRELHLTVPGTGEAITLDRNGPTFITFGGSGMSGDNQCYVGAIDNAGPGANTGLLQLFGGGFGGGEVEMFCQRIRWGNTVYGASRTGVLRHANFTFTIGPAGGGQDIDSVPAKIGGGTGRTQVSSRTLTFTPPSGPAYQIGDHIIGWYIEDSPTIFSNNFEVIGNPYFSAVNTIKFWLANDDAALDAPPINSTYTMHIVVLAKEPV